MVEVDTTEMIKDIVSDLARKLKDEGEDVKTSTLSIIVKKVVKEVILKRNYPDTMSASDILSDLDNHYATIIGVAEYDYNTIGAEGQTSHSENGVSRKFIERNKMFGDVFPFVRYLG